MYCMPACCRQGTRMILIILLGVNILHARFILIIIQFLQI